MHEVGQEIAVVSFFLSLKDPGHDPGVWWLSSSPGAEVAADAVGQVMVLSLTCSNMSFSVFPSRCNSKY